MDTQEYIKNLEKKNAYLQLVNMDMSNIIDIATDIILRTCDRKDVKIFISAYLKKLKMYRYDLENYCNFTREQLDDFDLKVASLSKFLQS